MNYENIYNLQMSGISFEDACKVDNAGIDADDIEEVNEFLNDEQEHEQYLQDAGFIWGTDNPRTIEQIESQEAFNDKLAMFRNEY